MNIKYKLYFAIFLKLLTNIIKFINYLPLIYNGGRIPAYNDYVIKRHRKPLCNKTLASEGKIVYNVLNMIIMGVVPTEGEA